MSELGINQRWSTAAAAAGKVSTGGQTEVYVSAPVNTWAFYIEKNNCTFTASLQSAITSTGPWVTEGSTTTASTAAEAFVFRGSGPLRWVRPYITAASSNAAANFINFRLVGYL